MIRKITSVFCIAFLIVGFYSIPPKKVHPPKTKTITIAFYNLENLFDTEDDPAINDAEFLPDGKNKWTPDKLSTKLQNLAKVIAKLGDEDGPELLGVSEVENRSVLDMLVDEPALKKHGYGIVHRDSPDERGIDVALLYKEKTFFPLYSEAYKVHLTDSTDRTRDILFVKGIVNKNHELAVIVNHWPSRSGGQEKSEPDRMAAAKVVRALVDSIYAMDPFASVVIMGDFNDDPEDKSMHEILKAGKDTLESKATLLYNPMYEIHKVDSYGSLMYNKKWNLFDQIIVNKPMAVGHGVMRYVPGSAHVYQPEWMRQQTEGDWKGAPMRTFIKAEFQPNGYSDHFPVYEKLEF